MRIDRLWLESFRNLVDIEVDFDERSHRQVIVGRNGVGKSNLLEAITTIFSDLDLEQPSRFAYEIEYFCNGYSVKVRCEKQPEVQGKAPRNDHKLFVKIALAADCSPLSRREHRPYKTLATSEFYKRNRRVNGSPNPQRLLPLYVFGYYSGSLTRFANIFATHEERYYRDQISGNEAPLRPLFQAKAHHSQFALLAFYATHDDHVQAFLEKECRITGFHSALFALREPYWRQSTKQPSSHKKDGDERFWNAGGKVAPFLDALFKNSFAPMAGRERIRVSIGQDKTKERRYCFIPDQKSLRSLASGLSNKEFFARLESLVFSDLINADGTDLRVWVNLKDCDTPATFDDLAEGERQLLTVLGLMRFTAEKEALFLLDEPDTHLNPAWCLDYLDNLRNYGAEPANSQILMTTHSPLTFAGLEKSEVVILERDVTGRVYAEHPASAPKGMGFSAILTSDYFGMRSTLDKETLKKIDEKRELVVKPDLTDDDRKRLDELNSELGRLDFSQAARDPLYIEFIRAMTVAQEQQPELKEPAPKKVSWRKRQQIAEDIAKKLLMKDPSR